MKDKRLWILLGGILLVGAAFLLLNFRLAASSTQAEKLLFTTDLGENMPVSMQRKDKISLVLLGEGPLVSSLHKALAEEMDKAGIGEIELVQEPKPVVQNPVLVVKVGKPAPIWTPFFAMSKFSIHAGYASDGDSTFMEAVEATHTSIAKKDVANMYAEYEVSDRSFGLISRLGYHRFLADYLAQEIVAALKDLYDV
jgi:hypothetical protein